MYATVHNHGEWQSLADQAALDYKAGKEDPICLIGHSLGRRCRVMEMAAYLNRKRIPVALVVPFDGTSSVPTPANVGRLVNLTQRKYAYMRPGPGFHGSLANVDVSSDPNIGHISIDKSPRLHARAISEVLAVVKGHRMAAPSGPNPAAANPPIAPKRMVATVLSPRKPQEGTRPPMKSSNGATNSTSGTNPPGESAPSSRSRKHANAPKGCPSRRAARLSPCLRTGGRPRISRAARSPSAMPRDMR